LRDDFVKPILVLALICLVVSGALAVTNGITEPVIADAAVQREKAARNEIIPAANDFDVLKVDGLPETVTEVYKSTNDVGYIFVLSTSGYGGELTLLCGVSPEGVLIRCMTLEHSETKGLGSRVTEQQFENQFIGMGAGLDGVEAISGATISSRAYIGAVRDALAAFETVVKMG
jgi:electron transport complex protein RnfG